MLYASAARRARDYLRPEYARMPYDEPGATSSTRGGEGRTGFPVVDAGMRQLRATGWMHNRVRMIVASFLVKDLHLEWQHGARHFMHWLVDGDLASNQHGWQWTAGCGTDASPYFRVFNPTTQGRKFDPRAAYVLRWVPELADAADPHEPEQRGPCARRATPSPWSTTRTSVGRRSSRWERITSVSAPARPSLVIPRRFCGPASSGNGGWTAGALRPTWRPDRCGCILRGRRPSSRS